LVCLLVPVVAANIEELSLSLVQISAKLFTEDLSAKAPPNVTKVPTAREKASRCSWSARTSTLVNIALKAAEGFVSTEMEDEIGDHIEATTSTAKAAKTAKHVKHVKGAKNAKDHVKPSPRGKKPDSDTDDPQEAAAAAAKDVEIEVEVGEKEDNPDMDAAEGEAEEAAEVTAGAARQAWKIFTGHIVACTVLVLLMCGDDLCWLLPFLTGEDKHSFAAFYVFCMFFMWALAWSLFLIAKSMEMTHPNLPVEELSDVMSTLLLLGLTVKFFMEWLEDDDGESACGTDRECEAQFKDMKVVVDAHADFSKEAKMKKRMSYFRLFLVSLGGNFDNIGVYIPIMLSGVFSPVELLIGDVIAAIVIALISLGLSGFKVLTDFFSQVPLFVIVGVLTTCVAVNCGITLAHSTAI